MNSRILLKHLADLRKNKELCDITIVSLEGEHHHVHSIMLAAASPVFKVMLTKDYKESNSKIIHLHDVTSYLIECFVSCIYEEECSVITNDNVMEIFILADRYEIKELSNYCEDRIILNIDINNCLEILRLGGQYNSNKLIDKSKKYISQNFELFARTNEYLKLTDTELYAMIKLDELSIKDEELLLDLVFRWIDDDKATRQKYTEKLLNCCRYSLMSLKFIEEKFLNLTIKNSDSVNVTGPLAKIYYGYKNLKNKNKSDNDLECLTTSYRLPRDVVFLIGGWNRGQTLNTFECFNNKSNAWYLTNHLKDTSGLRGYYAIESVAHIVYTIGGYDGRQYLNTMRQFNTITREWSDASPMHFRRCFTSAAVVDNTLYVIAGYDGERRLSSVETYCSSSNQWRLMKSFNTPRSDAACVALDNKIYLLGGYGGDALCSCEVYDVINDQWTFITQMNCKRSGACAVVLPCSKKIMIIGGYNGVSRIKATEIYDPETNTWTYGPSMCQERSNFAVCIMDNEVHVIGGYTGYTTVDSVEIFNEENNTWRFGQNINNRRSAMKAICLTHVPDMKLYFEGGEQLPTDSMTSSTDITMYAITSREQINEIT